MDAISPVGGPAAAMTPVAAPAASTSIVSTSSVTQVGGAPALAEGLAGLAGSGDAQDMMKLLVALLLMEALLGKDKSAGEKLGGILALSMLGQAAGGGSTVFESSSTLMVAQQGASAAYSQTAATSSVSIMG